jgi:hypothetical protein
MEEGLMASNAGASPHVQVPAAQPNYDVTDEGALGMWETIDSRSGVCDPGTFNVSHDWPSTGGWVQA